MHEIVGLLYSVHVLGRHIFFSLLRTHASVWPFLFSLKYTSAYSSYLLHYTRTQLCEQVSPQHLLYCRVFQILIKKIHSWSMHGSIAPCHHILWTHLLNRLARLLHSLALLFAVTSLSELFFDERKNWAIPILNLWFSALYFKVERRSRPTENVFCAFECFQGKMPFLVLGVWRENKKRIDAAGRWPSTAVCPM